MKEHRKRCQLTIVRPRPIIGVGILSDTSKKMLYYYYYREVLLSIDISSS